ncbi:transcription factor Ovo-like 2 [Temnothorax curvispinosus]|uniref:Transcription factor Ovo-like 2 n=1 Tax=Temnothorax curvispinosus TaxID=300111 RepID=A0A6J1R9Q4_9HYME|nr:transcription factor Ovo-like 2 [Temnothorax curvispinosus]
MSITQNSWSPPTRKGYMCPGCGKGLSHKYTLDRHLKTVCGKVRNTNGKWKCKDCNRTYESQGSLSRHYRYECHVNPQFRCVFCKRLFTQKCSLSRHLKKKHQKDVNVYVELGSYPSRSTTSASE